MNDDTEDYYSAAAVRELDRIAIGEFAIPGFELMRRAAAAAFAVLRRRWPEARSVLVFCGTGNNGGDGLVLAVLARQAGLQATVVLQGDSAAFRGDALRAWNMAREQAVPVMAAAELGKPSDFEVPDGVIVDALLGTGLSGEVRTECARLIELINASGLPVLAIDIPSGLSSDSGEVLGHAVRADATVTFIGRKLGQVKGQGPGYCGQLCFDDLGVPPGVYGALPEHLRPEALRPA